MGHDKTFLPAAGIEGLQRLLHAVINNPEYARPGSLPLVYEAGQGEGHPEHFDATCQQGIRWLSEQKIYPKAYWQSRNGNRAVILLGQVRRFNDLTAVRSFLDQLAAPSAGAADFPGVWGLNAFSAVKVNGEQCPHYWFLPRFEICIKDDQISFRCNLESSTSLYDDALLALSELEALLSECPAALPGLPAVVGKELVPNRSQWTQLIARALQAIHDQSFAKVVLARRTTLQLESPLCPEALLAASQRVNRHCYHFMVALAADHAFVGSTPERLYRRDGQVLTTEALAGTVAGSDDDAEAQKLADWLLHDPKNTYENQLVVDDIEGRLKDTVSNITIAPLRVVRLRRVQHLQRTIHARLLSANDAECVFRLQPTAAVAGLPRKAAREFIDQQEPFQRGWYAGSVGFCSVNAAEFAVTLRSALVEGDRIHLYAGCGIVAGSDPDSEWEELDRKTEALGLLLTGDR